MVGLDGPTSMVWFLYKNQFTKLLGPSLGVNRMWTKRNDHAPKVKNLIDFFKYMSRNDIFGENLKFDYFFVFISSSPKNIVVGG
jgi:hypothetical protein